MICVALAELTYEECLDALRALDFAEIRLDLLELSAEQQQQIFAGHSRLIATCRPGKYDDDTRKTVLLNTIHAGAAYVDIEVESGDAVKQELIKAARASGCQVIISYHNFEKTPERPELEHIIRWCVEDRPDIVKIACMSHSARDNARLLGLLDSQQPMVVLGMGEAGRLTRIISPLLGGVWTFAAYSPEKATAPGQCYYRDLDTMIQNLTHSTSSST